MLTEAGRVSGNFTPCKNYQQDVKPFNRKGFDFEPFLTWLSGLGKNTVYLFEKDFYDKFNNASTGA